MQLTPQVLQSIITTYGGAFYLLNTRQFQRNYLELQDAFRAYYPNFHIAYSYKTNYIPALCGIVNALGGYAEVVSDMEYALAKRIGVPPDRILFNGPYKQAAATEELLLSGGTVNIDSEDDFAQVAAIAAAHPEAMLRVGIRCNFDVGDGVVSRFGIDVASDAFPRVLEQIRRRPNLRFVGLHCHYAARRIEVWHARVSGMLALINTLATVPEWIDLGGGLFGKMDDSLKAQFDSEIPSYEAYAAAVAKPFAEAFYGKQAPLLLIEPGSALAGDVMQFAAPVTGIKQVRGKHIATVLGSIYNINPTRNTKNPPIAVYHTGAQPPCHYDDLDFGGFTCIESDYLYRHYSGALAVGDYVVFSNVGSYSVVLKPPFILPNFPILEIAPEGELRLIKRQETAEDVFHTYF